MAPEIKLWWGVLVWYDVGAGVGTGVASTSISSLSSSAIGGGIGGAASEECVPLWAVRCGACVIKAVA